MIQCGCVGERRLSADWCVFAVAFPLAIGFKRTSIERYDVAACGLTTPDPLYDRFVRRQRHVCAARNQTVATKRMFRSGGGKCSVVCGTHFRAQMNTFSVSFKPKGQYRVAFLEFVLELKALE